MTRAAPTPTASASPATSRRTWTLLLLLVVVSAVVRGLAARSVFLTEAEAYYGLWSRQLAWGYFDHPPMVAFVIRAFGGVADGSDVLGARAGAWVLGTVGLFALFGLYRRVLSERVALLATAFVAVAPFWFPFGVLVTPDAPLLVFWTLTLALFLRAHQAPTMPAWLSTGVALGACMLSKFNALQLPVVLGVFLLLTARGRAQLRSPGPWLMLVTAALVWSPNLAWNAGRAGGGALTTPFADGFDVGSALGHLGLLAVLPFVLMTPLLAWVWVRVSWAGLRSGRWRDDPRFLFLACASWLPLSAFAGVALLTEVHVHWVATCFVAAVPLAAGVLEGDAARGPGARSGRLALRLGVVCSMALWLAPAVILARGVSPDAVPEPGEDVEGAARLVWESRAWDELAARVEAELATRGDPDAFLATRNYHLLSSVAWLTRSRWEAWPLDEEHRHQFGLWGADEDFIGRDALLLDKGTAPRARRRIEAAFESIEPLEPVTTELGGRVVERFQLSWARGYRGMD